MSMRTYEQTPNLSTAPIRRWLRFAIGVCVILCVAFILIPWMQRFGMARELREFVEEHRIEATGLFYTEVVEFSEAEISIRDSLAGLND